MFKKIKDIYAKSSLSPNIKSSIGGLSAVLKQLELISQDIEQLNNHLSAQNNLSNIQSRINTIKHSAGIKALEKIYKQAEDIQVNTNLRTKTLWTYQEILQP